MGELRTVLYTLAIPSVLVNNKFVLSEEQLVEKIINHRKTETGIEVEVQRADQEKSTWEPVSDFKSKTSLKNYLYSYDINLKSRATVELWVLSNEEPPWFEVIPSEGRNAGRGIRILRDVVRGSFLLEYKGKLTLRGEEEITINPEYTYAFDHKGVKYRLDASEEDGNFCRLVNDAHPKSGKNNSEMFQVLLFNSDDAMRLVLVATRNIASGEELFHFYSRELQHNFKEDRSKDVEKTIILSENRGNESDLDDVGHPTVTSKDTKKTNEDAGSFLLAIPSFKCGYISSFAFHERLQRRIAVKIIFAVFPHYQFSAEIFSKS